MKSLSRFERSVRWVFIVAAAGVMPAFVMRCDKAALNFQRALYSGLGAGLSQAILDCGFLNCDGTTQ